MWPLSCYGYTKGAPCLPGLVDASMDELRWEAYQANVSGNLAKYLQNLNELWEKQMSVQRQFSNITEDDVRTMVRYRYMYMGLVSACLFNLLAAIKYKCSLW